MKTYKIKPIKRNYDFYYNYTDNSFNKIYVGTTFCSYPKMTKFYKNLKLNFNCGFIHSFSYSVSLPF